MKPARYDYLIIYTDKKSEGSEFMRSASRHTVQAWIDAHLSPDQLVEVRQVSLGEMSANDTDQFENPRCPAFDREASRADYLHQMEMEGAL